MRKFLFLALMISFCAKAQTDSVFVDNKYREDQIYLNLTYISLINTPPPISQSGFSFGLGGGFIRDLPLNSRRNIGLGAGLGYGFNNYFFNVRVETDDPEQERSLLNNKIIMHVVELPIELRFRTSTATRYKFWRFYPGFKMSYVFAERLSLGRNLDTDVADIIDYTDFLYGLTFSVGYNKWNLHMYYGLNDLFTNRLGNEYDFNITDFRIGLVFYVF